MDLLERGAVLEALGAALRDVAAGHGRVVLVSGEAGIGKTALVERFARTQGTAARVLWGACDALFTPRPLGHISAKTVDHHVSAILTKLDVPSRREADRVSRQWRLASQPGEVSGAK
jgi:predicted ATPase